MKKNTFFSRILIGIRRSPFKLMGSIFIIYAACWTIIEPILGMIPDAEKVLGGSEKYITLLCISVIVGIYKNASLKEIEIKFNNSQIKIEFGDLFSCNGIKGIPVSRFFYEIEVVRNSLQDIVIRQFMDSDEGAIGLDKYKQKLTNALENIYFEEKDRGISLA